jgi:hypothetical protein
MTDQRPPVENSSEKDPRLEIKLADIDSVALRRLIEEVRAGGAHPLSSYNRIYHRHNR